MRLRPTIRMPALGAVCGFALLAFPAQAHEGPYHDAPYPGWKESRGRPHQEPSAMASDERAAWLAECRHRLSIRDRRRDHEDGDREIDQCEDYLDSYYAYYRGYQGQGYAYPAHGYASPCCQPMMMAPAMRAPRGEPKCTETVEYEYVDVPARPKPRPLPDKRIKVVPDKRIPIK